MAGIAGGNGLDTCGEPVPVFHRLNAREYENTTNALLGTTLPLHEELPADALVFAFDNNADTAVSATHLQKYLNAAELAVEAAFADPASLSRLIPCTPLDTACVQASLQSFLTAAFRRPATEAEVASYASFFQICPETPESGLKCAFKAALTSPKYLFRTELLPGVNDLACTDSAAFTASAAGDLSEYALAARLSYFLVGSSPDATLIDLVARGALNDDAEIERQVRRLLDPATNQVNYRPFLNDFPTQWLAIAAIDHVEPSPELFPNFDADLRLAMREETRLFFEDVLLGGGSALDLVRANFTFLNERLAAHYGIAGVSGSEMRRVDTTGTMRGGLLTQGSFLVTTSSTENTSIVRRAKWVLTNLLCEKLPSPPPGAADQVPPPDPGLGLTNRESLEQRTANAPCNTCHAIINPIGYGLETYDAVGAQRSTQHDRSIDPSGDIPGLGSFATTDELLTLLRADERFPRCLTQKLLTYALGRATVAACDASIIDGLAADFQADGYQLLNQVVRIAQSDLFRTARVRVNSPAPEPPVPEMEP